MTLDLLVEHNVVQSANEVLGEVRVLREALSVTFCFVINVHFFIVILIGILERSNRLQEPTPLAQQPLPHHRVIFALPWFTVFRDCPDRLS